MRGEIEVTYNNKFVVNNSMATNNFFCQPLGVIVTLRMLTKSGML